VRGIRLCILGGLCIRYRGFLRGEGYVLGRAYDDMICLNVMQLEDALVGVRDSMAMKVFSPR
jgi:hypothetical protein